MSVNNKNLQEEMSHIVINGQYIKDLSFENPTPTENFQNTDFMPKMAIDVNVDVHNLESNSYEVNLYIKADASQNKKKLYILELQYSGIFTLSDIPDEAISPVLLIECPRLLFPFARQIIADITMNGGFPPLALDPIDFATIYKQQHLDKPEVSH